MNSKMNFVAVLAIILLVIGAAFASGILTFSFGASKETNESVFSMASKSSKGLVGQPLDFKVEHFEVEPYKGPYSYQWNFGDGTVRGRYQCDDAHVHELQ